MRIICNNLGNNTASQTNKGKRGRRFKHVSCDKEIRAWPRYANACPDDIARSPIVYTQRLSSLDIKQWGKQFLSVAHTFHTFRHSSFGPRNSCATPTRFTA